MSEEKSDVKSDSFEMIIQRMMEATGSISESELAKVLGRKPSAIYTARTRNSVPKQWINLIAQKFNVSKDWIRFGHGKPSRLPDEEIEKEFEYLLVSQDHHRESGIMVSDTSLLEKLKKAHAVLKDGGNVSSWTLSAVIDKLYSEREAAKLIEKLEDAPDDLLEAINQLIVLQRENKELKQRIESKDNSH